MEGRGKRGVGGRRGGREGEKVKGRRRGGEGEKVRTTQKDDRNGRRKEQRDK